MFSAIPIVKNVSKNLEALYIKTKKFTLNMMYFNLASRMLNAFKPLYLTRDPKFEFL